MKSSMKKLTYGFKFSSVLVRTFLLSILLVMVLTSAFLLYSLNVATNNYKEKTYTSKINMLTNTSKAIELTLMNISQVMRQTIQNSNSISAMVVPSTNNYDRTNSIVKQFSEIVSGYPLVKKVLLYIPTNNTVYSSDKSLLPISESRDLLLIDAIYNQNIQTTLLESSLYYSTKIIMLNDKMLLCQNLLPDYHNQIGSLIFEIDTNYLYETFLKDSSSISDLTYVLDNSGKMIFFQSENYMITPNIINKIADGKEAFGNISFNENNNNITCFFYKSPMTEWIYINPVVSTINPAPMLFEQDILVFFVILIIMGFMISMFIAYLLYSPIKEVVDSIIYNEGKRFVDIPMSHVKNEIDLFEFAYNKTTDKNEELEELLERVKPVALERLLINIIFDRYESVEEIKDMLQSIGNPILFQAKFTLLLFTVENEIDDLAPEYEMNIILMRMKSIISDDVPNDIYHSVFRLNDQYIATLLVFPNEMESNRVKQVIARVYDNILNDFANLPYRVIIGYSNIYKYISDLRYCYLEAQENLNRKYFYGKLEDGEHAASSIVNDFSNFIKRIMLNFTKGDIEHAKLIYRQVNDDIVKLDSFEDVVNGYRIFIDMIIEKLIALKLMNTDELLILKSDTDEKMTSSTDINELEKQIDLFFDKIALNIDERNKTKKYSNILRIREYIDENYSNRDISLDAVAKQVGISPSYLSRLFKEEMSMSFVDYINQIRIEKAKYLLINSDIPVKDIGYQTGFYSMQNFFRVFKKLTYITPGNYRQINQK